MNSTTAEEQSPRWAEIAYEAIAPVYDDFTHHHDYDLWIGNLWPKIEAHGIAGDRMLDIACGTGKSFLPMLAKGWRVTGCDVSPAMLEIARSKVSDEVSLSVADMRELPRFGEFDLVWCLDDAMNYLLSREELERTLAGMRANLAPNGLLVFDVNTITAHRTFFAEEVVVEREGRRLIWRGRASPDQQQGEIAEASFEVEPLPGSDAAPIAPEMHRERHFPEAVVREAMIAVGLEFLDVWGHEDDAVPQQPLEENRHSKAVYISRPAR